MVLIMAMKDLLEIAAFGKRMAVLENKVKVCNQILGCTLVGSPENVVQTRMNHGWYLVELDGCELARFRAYDIEGIQGAIERIEAVNDGYWVAIRQGILKVA